MPRLAKPDSPRATWNVSRSLSSWTGTAPRSALVSDAEVAGDELLPTGSLWLLSTPSSDVSVEGDTAATAATDAPLAGCYSNIQ